MKETLTIVKAGGKVLDDPHKLDLLIENFSKIEGKKLLVHGGGKSASTLAEKLGIEVEMHKGRRITNRKMLDIVTMVYAGLINKNIVAKIQSKGQNAIGLCGADLNIIKSNKRITKDIDYGFVGDVQEVNHNNLKKLIEEDSLPVIAPVTHDKQGNLLNTNADTVASTVASAMSHHYCVKLIFCFEKNGVLMDEDNNNSAISCMDKSYYEKLKSQGIIHSGMIPKMDNAFDALNKGVNTIVITNTENISDTCKNGTKLINSDEY
jgi:acetylglutamate kinase